MGLAAGKFKVLSLPNEKAKKVEKTDVLKFNAALQLKTLKAKIPMPKITVE